MKGYIPISIPTKPYIKAYILKKLGDNPVMSTGDNTIGHKLFDLLRHSNNERGARFSNSMYSCEVKVYIPINTFQKRGANLNATNLKNFNLFIEMEIKNRFHDLMDDSMDIVGNFTNNLPEVRRRLGIDLESWSDDSMQKDYYRYRLRYKKITKRNKTLSPTVR